MSRISRNVSIVLRTERLIAQRNMTVLAKRAGFFAAAGLAGALAIIMLNIAGYLALISVMTKPLAALVVAMINLAVALILAAIANSVSAEADTAPVAELRDMAVNDIESEVQDMLAEVRETAHGLRAVSRDPLGALTPGLVGMIASAVLKHLKTRKE